MVLSFFFPFWAVRRTFVLCLFGQCPGICTVCHSWQHSCLVHLSVQADSKGTFAIPVFCVCRSAGHDSSLCLSVLILFLEAVVFSKIMRSLQHFLSAHCSRGLGCCLQASHLRVRVSASYPFVYFRRIVIVASVVIFAVFLCRILCHQQNWRLVSNSPSIITPLFSQFILLTVLQCCREQNVWDC